MPRALLISLWAFTAMAQVSHRPPTAPGQSAIEGIVADANSHEPLKKVQVTLNGPITPPLMAVTDGAGRFAFHDLPAGGYWLNVSKYGYNLARTPFGAEPQSGVRLGAGEQKKGVEIALVPDAAIGGRVVNEEGFPVRGCSVAAVETGYEHNRRTLRTAAAAATDDKGEYRLRNVQPGRIYAFATCHAELPAAHPLLPVGDPRTPHETYLPQLYGGGLDPSAATRLTVVAGGNLEGVDFKVARVPAFTLSGRVAGSVPEALAGDVNVLLLPANRLMRSLMMSGTNADSQTHEFKIRSVVPGSYRLFAFTTRDGRMFAAQRTLEIGNVAPDPLEISLTGGSDLKGNVQFDSDEHPPLADSHISLAPLEGPWFMPQPHTQLDKDGHFTLADVMPGRWRLIVSVPGYTKSATLGGQQVSPYGFQIVAGAAGPLHIVMGAKMAEVHVSINGAASGQQLSALIFPEDSSQWGAGLERVGVAAGTGQADFGALPPGRYRVFATDVQNPWPILQRPDWLQALASHTAAIDVPESGRVNATVEITPRQDLMRMMADQE